MKFAASAVQVPESDCPFIGRAIHVPCQRLPVFCADQVPCRTTSPASLRSVHDPRAALGLCSEVCADHVPRKIWLEPAVAVHEPTRTGGVSWARAQELKIRPKIKLDTLIPTPGFLLMSHSHTRLDLTGRASRLAYYKVRFQPCVLLKD